MVELIVICGDFYFGGVIFYYGYLWLWLWECCCQVDVVGKGKCIYLCFGVWYVSRYGNVDVLCVVVDIVGRDGGLVRCVVVCCNGCVGGNYYL